MLTIECGSMINQGGRVWQRNARFGGQKRCGHDFPDKWANRIGPLLIVTMIGILNKNYH